MKRFHTFTFFAALIGLVWLVALANGPTYSVNAADLAQTYPTTTPIIIYVTPITPIAPTATAINSGSNLATVLSTVPVYSEPRANSNTVGALLSGQTWFVLGTDSTGRWVQIQIGASAKGWAVRAAFNLAGAQLPVIAGATGGPAPGGYTFRASRGHFVYTVRRGDTLGKLALRYRTTIRAIANANGLRNINLIYVGQRLIIP